MSDEIWVTKEHEKIKVKDMTTQHIENTIKAIDEGKIKFIIDLGWFDDNDFQIIEEDISKKEKWLNIFKLELERRKICLEKKRKQ